MKILVLGYTFRTNLDEYEYIHSSELLGTIDVLWSDAEVHYTQRVYEPLTGKKRHLALVVPCPIDYILQTYDVILLPSQFTSKRMLAEHAQDTPLLAHIAWCKELLKAWQKRPLFILEQDPRPKFTELYDEFPHAIVLTCHNAYDNDLPLQNEHKNINFGLASAKYTQGALLESMPIEHKGLVFAASSYDENRAKMLNKYAIEGSVSIGECLEYPLPNISQNKVWSLTPLKYHIGCSTYQLVLYSQHHIARRFWQTTRIFQALSWGSLCLVPIEYRQIVPQWFLPDEFFVANKQDIYDAIARRPELIEKQRIIVDKLFSMSYN